MKCIALGCTLILAAALIWSISLLSAAVIPLELRTGWGEMGPYWSNYFLEGGGTPITVISLALFISGLLLVVKGK